jgi:hypothetical protein
LIYDSIIGCKIKIAKGEKMKTIAIAFFVFVAVVIFSEVNSVKETPTAEYKYAVEFRSILNFRAETYARDNRLHYMKEGRFKTVIFANDEIEVQKIIGENS